MKYFYLILYIIKGTRGNLHRFFKENYLPATKTELKNSLRSYLNQIGLSLEEVEILSMHRLSENDYYEYKEQLYKVE